MVGANPSTLERSRFRAQQNGEIEQTEISSVRQVVEVVPANVEEKADALQASLPSSFSLLSS